MNPLLLVVLTAGMVAASAGVAGAGPRGRPAPAPAPKVDAPSAAGAPDARTVSLPQGDALRDLLTAPAFQFSPTKGGVTRRDPFQIPLTRIEIVKDSQGRSMDPQKYQELMAAEADRLKRLDADCDALQAAVLVDDQSKVLALYQKVETAFGAPFITKGNQVEAERIKGQFEALKPRIAKVLVAAAMVAAREKVAELKAAFAQAQYDKVVALSADFDRISAAPKDSPQWKALQAETLALARRARAHTEFVSKALRVTSVTITRSGGRAVINGVSCQEGARLDADTLVAKVTMDAILFVYKGEQIEYRLGST